MTADTIAPYARPTVNRSGYNYKARSSGLADLSRLRTNSMDVYVRAGKDMHKCLGCDPCPPGDLYAEYTKKKQKSDLITL